MGQTKNEIEVTGFLHEINLSKTTNGKDKLTVVLRVDAPKWMQERGTKDELVAFDVFGRHIEDYRGIATGALLRISGRISAREYQGKYYTNASAEHVAFPTGDRRGGAKSAAPPPPSEDVDDTPF